jgi:hypothetical protein
MAVRGANNILTQNNPQRGQVRNHIEVVQSGIDRHNPSEQSASALKTILKIEGDAMGTLNTQEFFNKTQDGGTFS